MAKGVTRKTPFGNVRTGTLPGGNRYTVMRGKTSLGTTWKSKQATSGSSPTRSLIKRDGAKEFTKVKVGKTPGGRSYSSVRAPEGTKSTTVSNHSRNKSSVQTKSTMGGKPTKMTFRGDLGNKSKPISKGPTNPVKKKA